jgi:hypothetical protein
MILIYINNFFLFSTFTHIYIILPLNLYKTYVSSVFHLYKSLISTQIISTLSTQLPNLIGVKVAMKLIKSEKSIV